MLVTLALWSPDNAEVCSQQPSRPQQGQSGHHGHPPSRPGHMRGAGGRVMDVTPSTRPVPKGHPSCLQVRTAP